MIFTRSSSVWPRLFSTVILIGFTGMLPQLQAADDDFDSYKIKISGYWFYAEPSGTLTGANNAGTINLTRDLGFNSYSTFTGKVNWKFTRKNHLYFLVNPVDFSHQTLLTRTIEFQGETFVAGLTTQSELQSEFVWTGLPVRYSPPKKGAFGYCRST